MKNPRIITPEPSPDEITPEVLFRSRRKFLTLGAAASTAAVLAACGIPTDSNGVPSITSVNTNEELLNPLEEIINYNNYYEFTTEKTDVAEMAKNFRTSPWSIEVTGLVNKPGIYSIEQLIKEFGEEERIYRLRCVEGWSMVIPWLGFPLASLIDTVEPKEEAKYVRFISILDPSQLPGQSSPFYPWPYQEGLRLDEAKNPLTLMATGLYNKPLPAQNGAPLRLVVPWKYGFKSIKAIVKIELVADQPATLWNTIAPREYGFYSNVNPSVNHPRWSQDTERRIGEIGRRATRMFNGYEKDVSYLYEGMDLRANY
jgi:sulfoxide reductase catalytic subunit YedY